MTLGHQSSMISKIVKILLVLALATIALGCSLTHRLATRRDVGRASAAVYLPTRTPWPTFTASPEVTAAPLPVPTVTPLPTDTPAPTDIPPPTETPLPIDTPTPPPPAPPPTPVPPPTEEPGPPPTEEPKFQYTPLGFEAQWNAGLAQIRGHIYDAAGSPVNGVYVQIKCGGTVLASNPSGINMYAPGAPYEAGAFDVILSSPLSPDSMCNWEVRVVEAASFEEASNLAAPALSDIAYCDLTWDEMSVCFANWRKNW